MECAGTAGGLAPASGSAARSRGTRLARASGGDGDGAGLVGRVHYLAMSRIETRNRLITKRTKTMHEMRSISE